MNKEYNLKKRSKKNKTKRQTREKCIKINKRKQKENELLHK